jgi:nitrogen fixation protein FixH
MGELTGRHVLAITVGAFGVIIAVNLFMAYQAVSTFPGLEVDNSYVASQVFDSNRTAQKALGWELKHSYDSDQKKLFLNFVGADGLPAKLDNLDVLVGRTTEARDDSRPEFVFNGEVWSAPIDLRPGKWMLHVQAHAADGTLFQQRIDLFVKG